LIFTASLLDVQH